MPEQEVEAPLKMLHDVKRLLGRLLRDRLGARQSLPAPPTFEEGALFDHLREPNDAVAAWRNGNPEAAWEVLIGHFRQRAPALGFFAPEQVTSLLFDAERRFPAWRKRLLAKVGEDRYQGLATYDRRAGLLSAAFDWSVVTAGPLEDRLYGARPHRFGFLPRWALACHFDRRLITELEAVLAGWMAVADRPGGHPAFRSSHVVVYHFMALLLAWPFLAALEDEGEGAALASLRRRALLILYEDSRFMREAAGSGVANNHLLAERFADWLVAALLPEFDHGLERSSAEETWLDELYRQTYNDGGSIEHSVHYQEHACEMAVAYLLLSRRNGWPIPEHTLDRIERMLNFQLAMAGPALLPLGLGNTTEDPLLALGVGEGWQCGFLREVQRSYFTPDAPATPDEDPTRETAFWLLEGRLSEGRDVLQGEAAFQDFPESGYCVLAESEVPARLIFRLGPLPASPGIGGHSHCDLLSLCLSVGDALVLAPPGTGSYRFMPHPNLPGRPNLRAHFASASCRSGFFIDGQEPYGPLKGDFRNWRLPCQVESRRASAAAAGLSWVEGRVVGTGPYVGQRRGVIHVWQRCWLVYDRAPSRQTSEAAFIGWQFAPGATCRVEEGRRIEVLGAAAATPLHMLSCGAGEATVASGSTDPFRGWVSPSYGRLEPAPNLRFPLPLESAGAAFFLSTESTAGQRLEQVVDDGDKLAFRMSSSGEEMLLLLGVAGRPTEVQWADVSFHGRLLFACRGPEGLRIRALGLTRLTAPSWQLELTAREPADFELLLAGDATLWPRGNLPHPKVEIRRGGT
ncbi:MAG: heparinase II/III family protein [Kiloniellaceae bacterium]